MAPRSHCRHCRLRIYWFPSWKRWGRQSGEAKYKFRCAMHTEGGDHEPLIDEVTG